MGKFVSKSKFLILGILLVLLVLIVLMVSYYTKKIPIWNAKNNVNTKSLYEVKTGNIAVSEEGVATLVPAKETNLYFKEVSGVLQKINVKVNDIVSVGQIIGEISADNIDLQISQAHIGDKTLDLNLRKQELSIANMNKTIEISKMEVDSSIKILSDAKTTLETSAKELDKVEKIANEEDKEVALIPVKVRNTQAQSDYDKALEDNRKSILKYQQYQNQLESLNLDKKVLGYQSQISEIKTQALKKSLENCKLVASTGGKITFLDNVSLLDYISAGRVIAKIVEEKDYVLQFTSANISNFKPGMKVKINVNGKDYNGAVYQPASGDLIKAEDSSVKTKTQVYFTLEEPIKDLSLGDRTTVSVTTEEKTGVIVVPKSAIKINGSKITVSKYNNGKIETVEIVKGIETSSKVEVLKGLSSGDKIVNSY